MTNTAAERLQAARLQLGISGADIAAAAGMTLATYEDLEQYESDLMMTVSLRQLKIILQRLRLDAAVFSDEKVSKSVKVEDLLSAIEKDAKRSPKGVEDFEDRVGWRVSPALASAEAVGDWNIDQLKAVSDAIGYRWTEVLAGYLSDSP